MASDSAFKCPVPLWSPGSGQEQTSAWAGNGQSGYVINRFVTGRQWEPTDSVNQSVTHL